MSANLKRKAPEEDEPVKKVASKMNTENSDEEDSDDGLQVKHNFEKLYNAY